MNALIYGATGYTGRLITRMAAGYGIRPILAGRNGRSVAALAADHGLEHRTFPLDDPDAVTQGLTGVAVVLHCAGPFSRTWRPMVDACLAGRVHYLDITGEIDVFQGIAALDDAARQAGVMLLPGVGFDVVPTDCLAALLADRLPGATRLTLAISGSGPLSHGTATTALENQHRGGRIRREGVLVDVPPAWRVRVIDFGDGRPRTTMTIPWGDVATACHTTGIGNIEVYAAVPRRLVRLIRASGRIGWLLRSAPVRAMQRLLLRARPAGPDEKELAGGVSRVWGRVEDARGRSETATLRGPNAYLLTAHSALMILQRALAGQVKSGYQTPARAYGAGLVLGVPGVSVSDAGEDVDTDGRNG